MTTWRMNSPPLPLLGLILGAPKEGGALALHEVAPPAGEQAHALLAFVAKHEAWVCIALPGLRPPCACIVPVRAPRGCRRGRRRELHVLDLDRLLPREGVLAHVDPLGCGPLLPPHHWAAAMVGALVQNPRRVEGEEEHRVPLDGLHGEALAPTVGVLRAVLIRPGRHVGKDRLPPMLGGAEVHKHGRDAVPPVVHPLLVEEVVEVRIVLLPDLVPQDLDVFPVLRGDE
mmetsp:Transcript_22604/g.70178  ORF Transcript_22604/g.70178 Transcript_22604/m.70178 type:complete len:229 (-) Transcript_22604:557-1243(-)